MNRRQIERAKDAEAQKIKADAVKTLKKQAIEKNLKSITDRLKITVVEKWTKDEEKSAIRKISNVAYIFFQDKALVLNVFSLIFFISCDCKADIYYCEGISGRRFYECRSVQRSTAAES